MEGDGGMAVEAYYRPTTLEEALDLTAEYTSSIEIISGGTITMPEINEGHKFPRYVMDLRELDLDYTETRDGYMSLGATLTMTQVLDQIDEPMLQKAARHTGGWAVRNLGTIGGNLFAPPPLGDFAVALLALDADVIVRDRDGDRRIPLSDFYTTSGERGINSDELVTEIRIPTVEGQTVYLKYTRSQEPAPSIVTVAVNLRCRDDTVTDVRICLNGAGSHPMRMRNAEEIVTESVLDEPILDRAADAAAEAADPPEDAIASKWYRRKMIRHHVSNTLTRFTDAEDKQ